MRIYNPYKQRTSLLRQFFDGLKQGLKDFGQLMSGLINALVLSIVYILGIGASFLIAKLKKKELLEQESWHSDSYYSDIESKDEGLDKLIKQF